MYDASYEPGPDVRISCVSTAGVVVAEQWTTLNRREKEGVIMAAACFQLYSPHVSSVGGSAKNRQQSGGNQLFRNCS